MDSLFSVKSTGATVLTTRIVRFQTWKICSTFSLNWRVKRSWISWGVQAVTQNVKMSNTPYTKLKLKSTGRRIGPLRCSSFPNLLLLSIPPSILVTILMIASVILVVSWVSSLDGRLLPLSTQYLPLLHLWKWRQQSDTKTYIVFNKL